MYQSPEAKNMQASLERIDATLSELVQPYDTQNSQVSRLEPRLFLYAYTPLHDWTASKDYELLRVSDGRGQRRWELSDIPKRAYNERTQYNICAALGYCTMFAFEDGHKKDMVRSDPSDAHNIVHDVEIICRSLLIAHEPRLTGAEKRMFDMISKKTDEQNDKPAEIIQFPQRTQRH